MEDDLEINTKLEGRYEAHILDYGPHCLPCYRATGRRLSARAAPS
jgi:hypothetical protein